MDKRFQYLPDVLVNIILEDHGGIIHREKMVEIKKQIEREGIIKLMKRYNSFKFKRGKSYTKRLKLIYFFY